MPHTPETLAKIAEIVATEASQIVLSGYRSRPVSTEKGQRDLVTEFDLRSEAHIRSRLAELSPNLPVVAEEGGGTGQAGPTWYCDPLDGTTNFVHGHPFWAVSLGVLDHGEAIAGAVVAPCLDTRWTGYRGGPALRNGKPCRPSETERVSHALLATGFPTDRERAPDNNFDSYVAIKKVAQGVRRCGSAAVDLCFVADGTYDGYWERRLNAWDLAGGAAVALAAGVTLTALGGGPPVLEVGHILASNGKIHAELSALLQPYL